MDLTTSYLGLKLKSPLVAAATPLSGRIDISSGQKTKDMFFINENRIVSVFDKELFFCHA